MKRNVVCYALFPYSTRLFLEQLCVYFGEAASVEDDVGVKAGHVKVIVNLAPVESQMEVAPAHPIDIVESVVNEKQAQEVSPIEAAGNNHTEVNNVVKAHEPEVLQAPVEENQSADAVVAPSSSRDGDAVVLEPPVSSRVSESAEVVTPAGTVEVETPHCSSDTPTEAAEKVVVVPTLEPVEVESPVNTVESKAGEDLTIDKTESVEQHDATSKSSTAFTEVKLENTPLAAEPAPTDSVSATSPSKKAKSDKKHTIVRLTVYSLDNYSQLTGCLFPQSDSFASDEVLSEVQKFLTLQVRKHRSH
ncbi:hypothetical protein DVH05_015014 [Phytophthora capsici]|nr:hypothetical protein DVH05_015014 [Phytophthora capsici]